MGFRKRHDTGQAFPVDNSGVNSASFAAAAAGDGARQAAMCLPGMQNRKPVSNPYDQSEKTPFVTVEVANGYGGGTVDFESGYSLPIPESHKMGLYDKIVIRASPKAIVYYILDKGGSVKDVYRLPSGRRKNWTDQYKLYLSNLDRDMKKDPNRYSPESYAEMRGGYMRTLSILDPKTALKMRKR